MNNKFNMKLLIVMFFIIIALPNIIYTLIPLEKRSNKENRVLKEKPILDIKNLSSYSKEYEEYYNDNIPFKDLLVKTNSILKYKAFDIIQEEAVINGKGGWLFYNSKEKGDGDTVADYRGSNLYTDMELLKIKEVLMDKKKFLDSQGIEFYILIPPNKSNIYSEYMPDKYTKVSEYSRVEQAIDYLRENTDINIVYPKDEMLKQKVNHQLYYKLDSHWNFKGAYVGYYELMKAIDSDFKYKLIDEVAERPHTVTEGDLAKMANLDGVLKDTSYLVDHFRIDMNIEVKEEANGVSRFSTNSENDKKILVYTDSFGEHLARFLLTDFKESVFLMKKPFSEEFIKSEKPDIVVIEAVERLFMIGD